METVFDARKINFLFIFLVSLSLSTFLAAQETEPPDPDTVEKQIDRGQYDKSIEQLRSYLSGESMKHRARLLHLFVRAQRVTGNYDEAMTRVRTFLKQGAKKEGHDASGVRTIRTDLAHLLFLTGAHQEALEHANQVIEEAPDHLRARWIRLRVHRRTGAYEKMKTDFRHARQFARKQGKRIDDAETALHLARIRWMDGSWNGKTRVVQQVNRRLSNLTRKFKKQPRLLTLWADIFREKHRDGDARQTYKDVLSFNEAYPPVLVGMAKVMLRNRTSLRVGDEQVDQMVEKAIDINPGYLPALAMKARQQLIEKTYDEAKETIQDAIETNRNHPRALSLKAVYHFMRNENEAYETVRKNVHDINEKYGTLYAMLARVLNEDHRYHRAQEFFDRAIERNPHLWTVLRDRGINELRLGNEEKGKKILEQAFQHNRFDVLAYNSLELLDKLEEKFTTYTVPGYIVRIHQMEAEYAHPYVLRHLKRVRREFTDRYGFQLDEPTLVEMFEDHRDFSVRTAGLQGLGALGACFGTVSIALSPRAKDQMGAFNWGAILWHEMGHAYALQQSNMRVPRWFTEGLSTYEEKRGNPSWERDKEHKLYRAWKADKLPTVQELVDGKGGGLLTYYLYGSVIIDFIVKEHSFDAIPEILESYGEGHSTEEAFQAVLDTSLAEFQASFDEYLKERFGSLPFRPPLSAERAGKVQRNVKPGKENSPDLPDPSDLVEELGQEDTDDEDDGPTYDELIRRARVFAARRRGDRARQLAKRAKAKDGSRPMAYAVMGDVRFREQNWTEAVLLYEKAYDRGGTDMSTLLRYGKSLEKTDDVDQAITVYEEARDAFPNYVNEDLNPYLQLYPLYIEKEKPQKALGALEAYTKRAHKDFSNHMKLASLYHDMEQWEKARSVLERMLYINYRDLKLHRYLADAYEGLEQWKRAHTERHVIVDLLEQINDETKKWEDLIAKNLYHAARMSAKLGKTDRARKEVRKARERGFSLKKVRQFLQNLNS